MRRRFLKIFFRKLAFLGAQQSIKISDQEDGHLKRRALLNKHFSKNKIQISPMRKQRLAISTFFHYKSIAHVYKLPWQPEPSSDLNKKQNFWSPTGLEIFLRTYSSCGASCKQFSLVLTAGALVLKIWISKETKIIKN